MVRAMRGMGVEGILLAATRSTATRCAPPPVPHPKGIVQGAIGWEPTHILKRHSSSSSWVCVLTSSSLTSGSNSTCHPETAQSARSVRPGTRFPSLQGPGARCAARCMPALLPQARHRCRHRPRRQPWAPQAQPSAPRPWAPRSWPPPQPSARFVCLRSGEAAFCPGFCAPEKRTPPPPYVGS